jgi:hypothetical protein
LSTKGARVLKTYEDYGVPEILDNLRQMVHIYSTTKKLYSIELIDDTQYVFCSDHILLVHKLFPELIGQGYEWKMFYRWPHYDLAITPYSEHLARGLYLQENRKRRSENSSYWL